MNLGRSVVSAAPNSQGVSLKLDDGTERVVDHVLLGTGYRVDVSKYEFLAPELAHSISQFQGYPRLREGFETSVPGLHIIGAPAVWSFGALMQFVVGTHYAARTLCRSIAGKTARDRLQVCEPMVAEVG
jgi:hypothetical protein